MKNISLLSMAITLAGLMCSTSLFAQTAPTEAAPVPTVAAKRVLSIYSDSYSFAPSSLNSYNEGWWDQPTLAEENIGGNKMLHYSGRMTGMIGWQFGTLNCSKMEKLHVDIWVPTTGTIDFGPTSADPTVVATKKINVTGGQWNSFDFDLATDFSTLALAKMFQHQFMNYSAQTDLYVDNYFFYRTTDPEDDTEAPTNFTATLKSVGYFSVDVNVKADDNSGGVIFKAYNNDTELASFSAASGEQAVLTVPGLLPTTEYTLVIKATDAAGNVNESPITITATTLSAPAPAAAPKAEAKNVMSVYSDAYTAAVTWQMGQWGQSTVMQRGNLAVGDEAILCSNSTYLGWEFNGTIPSFAGMEKIHMDIYVDAAASVQYTPIWKNNVGATAEAVKTFQLTAGWNALDIVLSEQWPDMNLATIFQMKWAEMPSTMWLDNVYFYKEGQTALPKVEVANKAQKMIQNGRLVIMNNGRVISVLGQDM